MTRQVVLLSHGRDLALPRMTEAVRRRGARPVPVCTERYPADVRVSLHDADTLCLDAGDGPVTLAPTDAIWVRRPRVAEATPFDVPEPWRQRGVEHSRETFDAILDVAPCAVFTRPQIATHAAHKPRQLALARACGLRVPPTLLTNDPDAAAAFLDGLGGPAIAKLLDAWPMYDAHGRMLSMPTRIVDDAVRNGLGALRYGPMAFQARIHKVRELRVTVIGARVFVAALDEHHLDAHEVDWRLRRHELFAAWRADRLPAEVERSLLALLDRLGLEYAACDLLVTADGAHVFLEANPAGEYEWLEQAPPHLPLTEAWVDLLLDVPGARRLG